MHRILLLGAGRSTASLISYLLTNAAAKGWHLTIGDLSAAHLAGHLAQHPDHLALVAFDINQPTNLAELVDAADVVISMLPAAFHLPVARACVRQRRPLVTAPALSPPGRAGWMAVNSWQAFCRRRHGRGRLDVA